MAVAALNASTPSLEAAMSMATEGHGGHAELTHNQTVNALMAITAGLVFITLLFEHLQMLTSRCARKVWGHHSLSSEALRVTLDCFAVVRLQELHGVVTVLWGELTALGFISLIVFLLSEFQFFTVFDEDHQEAVKEMVEAVHIDLFLVMVIFLISVIALIRLATSTIERWRHFESIRSTSSVPEIIQAYCLHQDSGSSGCCGRVSTWYRGLMEYASFRHEFTSPRATTLGRVGYIGGSQMIPRGNNAAARGSMRSLVRRGSTSSDRRGSTDSAAGEAKRGDTDGRSSGGEEAKGSQSEAAATTSVQLQSLHTAGDDVDGPLGTTVTAMASPAGGGEEAPAPPISPRASAQRRYSSQRGFGMEASDMLAERRLTRNFDFAEYLSLCSGEALEEIVEIGSSTWLTWLLIFLAAVNIGRIEDTTIVLGLFLAFGYVLPIAGALLAYHLSRIKRALLNRAAFAVATTIRGRRATNEMASAEEAKPQQPIPWGEHLPSYLYGPAVNTRQKTCCFRQRSKHQRLFLCGRPHAVLFCLRLMMVLHAMYVAGLGVAIFEAEESHSPAYVYPIIVVVGLIPSILTLTFVPAIFRRYVVVTSVEQMRKKEIITKVLLTMRIRRAMAALRVIVSLQNAPHLSPTSDSPPDRHFSSNSHELHHQAHQAQHHKELREVFDLFDHNNSGYLSITELGELLESLGREISGERLQELQDMLDTDNDGKLSFQEFSRFITLQESSAQHHDTKSASDQLFQLMDKDNSGTVSPDELYQTLERLGESHLSPEDISLIVDLFYENSVHGVITKEEFEHKLKEWIHLGV